MCLKNIVQSRDLTLPYNPLDTDCFIEFEDRCDYIELEETESIKIDKQDFVVLQLNIPGLIGKQKELSRFLFDILGRSFVDVVILCETWLTKESEKWVSFPGYIYHGIARKHKKGGGVGFLIKEGLKFSEHEILSGCQEDYESCFVEISLSGEKILVGNLYRPPNSNCKSFLDFYSDLSMSISKKYKNYMIGLDHNLNLLNHENHRDTQSFLELIIDNDQFPCIT